MLDMTLREFTDALGSKAPIPGGGGASALCASLAAALGGMVCALTSGKEKFASVQPELDAVTVEAEELKDELLALIDGDAAAFGPLSKAYSLPKDVPGRDAVMEKCLADAAAAPMAILEGCCRVIALLERLEPICSRLAVSDVATGAVLAWGAMYGSAMNVLVNAKYMKDREKAAELNLKVNTLMGEYWQRADKLYEKIYADLS